MGDGEHNIAPEIVKLLSDVSHYEEVFKYISRKVVTPSIVRCAVGCHDEGVALGLIEVALEMGEMARVDIALLERPLACGHHNLTIKLMKLADEETLAAAIRQFRFNASDVPSIFSHFLPPVCTTLLHLAVLLHKSDLVHRILSSPLCIESLPSGCRQGLASFTVMHSPNLVELLYSVLNPLGLFCSEEPLKWENETQLSPLHWALCLPGRSQLVSRLLKSIGVNMIAKVHTESGMSSGQQGRNWRQSEAVDILQGIETGKGIVEAIHPVVVAIAPLSPKLPTVSPEERLANVTRIMQCPDLNLTLPSVILTLECIFRRQIWQNGQVCEVILALIKSLPSGAKIPICHALPVSTSPVDESELRSSASYTCLLLQHFGEYLDVNAPNELGLSPVHCAAYYSMPLVLDGLLSHSDIKPVMKCPSPACTGSLLSIAAQHSTDDVVAILLRCSSTGSTDILEERQLFSLKTPLHSVCARLLLPSAMALAKRCPDHILTLQSLPCQYTPLHILCYAALRCLKNASENNNPTNSEGVISSDQVINFMVSATNLTQIPDSTFKLLDAIAVKMISAPLLLVVDSHQNSVVHLAAELGLVGFFKHARKMKTFAAAVILRNSSKESSLHCAAKSHRPEAVEIIKIISGCGVSVELQKATDCAGRSVLATALQNKYVPGVVIAALRDMSEGNPHDFNLAYHNATAIATPSAISQLEDCTKLCQVDKLGRSALHYFALNGDVECLQIALTRIKANIAPAIAIRDSCGDNLFHSLLSNGKQNSVNFAERLLRDYPSACHQLLQTKGELGRTPIHVAASRNFVTFIQVAISSYQDPSWVVEDFQGLTPAGLALKQKHTFLAWWLLNKELTQNPVDERGRTVLLQAAGSDNSDLSVLKDILNSKHPNVDLSDFDSNKNTILHCAAECSPSQLGNEKIVTLLRVKTISIKTISARNSDYKSALTLAVHNGLHIGVQELISVGAVPQQFHLSDGLLNGHSETAIILLKYGIPPSPGCIRDSMNYCSVDTTKEVLTRVRHSSNLSVRLDCISALRDAAAIISSAANKDSEKQLLSLACELHLVSRCSESFSMLVSSVEVWHASQKSPSHGSASLPLSPDMFSRVVIDTALFDPGSGIATRGSSALFKFFSLILIGHVLRSAPHQNSHRMLPADTDWKSCALRLPKLSELPKELLQYCSAAHGVIFLLVDSENDSDATMSKMLTGSFSEAPTLTTPEQSFSYRSDILLAMFQLTQCGSTLLHLREKNPNQFKLQCDSQKLWEMAIREGGTKEHIYAAHYESVDSTDFLSIFLSGRHSDNSELLQTLLDFRPVLTESTLVHLRNHNLLEKVNANGDSILHLLVMTDDPKLFNFIEASHVDPGHQNKFGLKAVDYCKSGVVMREIINLVGHPPLAEITDADYLICLSDVAPTFVSDPVGAMIRKVSTLCSCNCMQPLEKKIRDNTKPQSLETGETDGQLISKLESQLTDQRVIIYKSPVGVPETWMLRIPSYRMHELFKENEVRTGGHGETSKDDDSDDDDNELIPFSAMARPHEVIQTTRLLRIRMLRILLNPFESNIDLVDYQQQKCITCVAPIYLHDPEVSNALFSKFTGLYPLNSWRAFCGFTVSTSPSTSLISQLRKYAGESVAFYFSWLSCYVIWLLMVFPVAVGFLFIQLQTSYRNKYHGVFGGVMILWGIAFTKNWTRRETELGAMWKVFTRPRADCPRATFRPMIDEETGKFLTEPNDFNPHKRDPYFPPGMRTSRYVLSAFVLTIFWVVCAFEFLVFVYVREYLQNKPSSSSVDISSTRTITTTLLSTNSSEEGGNTILLLLLSVGHSLAVAVVEVIYRSIADVLTEFENHKYPRDFSSSLVIKYMSLQLLNAYGPTMWILFKDSSDFGEEIGFRNTSLHISARLGMDVFLGFAKEYILPYLRKSFDTKSMSQVSPLMPKVWGSAIRFTQIHSGEGYVREDFRKMYGEFSEMIIQFGFVVGFSAVCPLAIIIAVVNNFVEIRGDIFKVLKIGNRVIPHRAHGIGPWRVITKGLVGGAIFSNTLIMSQSTEFRDIFWDYPVDTVALALVFLFLSTYWLVCALLYCFMNTAQC